MPQQAKPAAARPRAAARPGFRPAAPRSRRDGWTPERQVAFVDALAASACVAEACAAVGLSRASAYALRVRPDAQEFRMAWDAALDVAVRRLGDECFSRALNGVPVPHFYRGEQVGEHRRYDNRLAMFLLRYRDPLRYAATLDQMVYKGHPEQAATAFARARNRVADEAHGFPADEAEPVPAAPWSAVPVAEETEAERERLIVEGDGPITGSAERRNRLWDRRRAFKLQQREDEAAALGAMLAGGAVAAGG